MDDRKEFLKEVAILNPAHCISLVQDSRTSKIYVKKLLTVFQADVFYRLQSCHIPGTPYIYDVYHVDKKLCVIEEYISGNTLYELITQGQTFSSELIQAIITQLCGILTKLHSLTPPIIHRDIKPSNIMLSPEGRVYLLDMNAARNSVPDKEEDTRLLGTKGYAAPEQYGFGASDPRTDIYAVGKLLNELLDHSTNPQQESLRTIAACCCEMDPRMRYQSAYALSLAISPDNDIPKNIPKNYLRLPGFRTNNPLLHLLSTVGYVMLIGLCFSSGFNTDNVIILWVDRITFFIAFFSAILFAGNYMDVQARIPFCKSKNILLRIIAVCFVDFVIILSIILISVIIVSLFPS